MKSLILALVLFTQIQAQEEYKIPEFHTGSTIEMDKQLEDAELMQDSILVNKLVSVYTKKSTEYTKYIIKYAYKYNIDPLTLAAVLAKESSFSVYAKHKPVYVKIPLKKNWTKIGTKEVQAVGLGGVIYEIWKYELKEVNINSRKELFEAEINIKATAKILSIYTHEKRQLKGTSSKEESALLRYYGVMRDKTGKPKKVYSKQVYKIKKTIIKM